jgi:hypothetical protein
MPSVRAGTEGKVVKIVESGSDSWRVRVQWQIPRSVSLIDAGEVSFYKGEKPVTSDFTKSEYEDSIEEIA